VPVTSRHLAINALTSLNIRARLTLAMIVLITVTVLAASGITVRNFREQEESKLYEQANHDVALVSTAFDGTGRLLLAQADLLASSSRVHVAMAAADHDALADYLLPRAQVLGGNTVEVITADGSVLLHDLGPVPSDSMLLQLPTIQDAMQGKAAVALDHDMSEGKAAGWALRAAVPVVEGNQVIGVLTLAKHVDEDLARQLAGVAGSDASVTITSGMLIVASSQQDQSGGSVVGRTLPPALIKPLERTNKMVERSDVFGLDAVYGVTPYTGPSGERAGYIVVAEPLTLAQAAVRASIPRIAQAFLGFLLLGFLLSGLIGRTISRPIRRLSRSATRLASGDLSVPIFVEGDDEVASLARVMERMRSGLALLFEGSRALASSLELDEVLRRLCGLVVTALGGNRAFVFMVADDGVTATGASAMGVDIAAFQQERLSLRDDPLLDAAMKSAKPLLVVHDTATSSPCDSIAERYGLKSILALSLRHGDHVSGVLIVGHTDLPHRFGANQIPLAEAFAQQAGVAIENTRLFRRVRDDQRYLESIISTTPDAICTLDGDGRFEFANEPTYKQLGFTREELLHQHFSVCYPAEHQERARAEWERLKQAGTVEFSATIQRKNGEHRTASLTLAPIEPNRRYVVIARDITDRVRLVAEIQQRNRELDTLYKMADTVSASLDVTTVLQQALTHLLTTMGADAGRIYLVDPDQGDLVLAAQVGTADRHAQGLGRLRPGERLTGLVAQQRTPLIVDDIQTDPRAAPQAKAEGIRSYVGVPLIAKQEVAGVLSVESYRLRPFLPREVELLMAIGHEIAVAIENSRLYERARELAVAEERNRLAREIHDTLAQGFTAITLQLELAKAVIDDDPALALASIEKSLLLSRSNLDEARRSVMDLRAAPLQDLSLPQALQRLAHTVERESGITVAFEQFGASRMGRLPSRVEAGLYRIAQEALTNVRRHAKAPHVDVMLNYDGRELHLVVQDSGQGFDPMTQPGLNELGGFGLVGMRERARLLGGSAQVSSAPGIGTRVEITVPDTWSRYALPVQAEEATAASVS